MGRTSTDPSTHRAGALGEAVLRAAAALGIKPAHLARVLGLSVGSISRLARGAYTLKRRQKSWERAVLVVRLHQGLESIMASDPVAMRSWMRSSNTDLHAEPVELIATAQGLVCVVGYVEAFRAKV